MQAPILPSFMLPTIMILACVFVAPYTKVEESFNMQAVHDLLAYGVRRPATAAEAGAGDWLRAHYDHFAFPGAVPRSFVGAAALAAASRPLALFLHGEALQVGVRALLGLWNAACMALFARGVQRAFGGQTGAHLLSFQSAQFHLVYYAGRTLPNFLAFGPVLLALGDLLPRPLDAPGRGGAVRRRQRALVLLTVMGIVFRSELAVLLACHTLNEIWNRRLGIFHVIQAGIVGLIVGLALTVTTDSFFWQKPVWPELNAFIFNVIEGKSEEWGVAPFYYYFLNSLPKLLFNPILLFVCIPIAMLRDVRVLDIILPNMLYVVILSFQGHKEWRFVIYIVPSLTAVAAVGFDRLMKSSAKSKQTQALKIVVVLSHLLSVAATCIFLVISSLNYPGAAALNRFHILSEASNPSGAVLVHMDTLTCMTGVTRFLEIPSLPDKRPGLTGHDYHWKYDKEENETTLLDVDFWSQFDFAIAENPERAIGVWEVPDSSGIVTSYSGFVITKSVSELERQQTNVLQSGEDPLGSFRWSNLGQILLTVWNDIGLSLSPATKGRWLTICMEPKLYILKRRSVDELA